MKKRKTIKKRSVKKMDRKIPLAIALVLIIAAIAYLEASKQKPASTESSSVAMDLMGNAEKARLYPAAKELVAPNGFINSQNITLRQFVGKKVVLVDFWTYSCINCQRTLPYLNAWYDKYKDKGLQIVGVHTPEFEFEKDYANVKEAVARFGIKYPVVLDNDYATWNAYRNRYWPHEYLIDIDGFVVHDNIGEGGYEETEKAIQQALEERLTRLKLADGVKDGTVQVSAETPHTMSPETYFGSQRNEFLANGGKHKDGVQELAMPPHVDANALYLSGNWLFSPEYAEALEAGDKIVFRYNSQKAFLVAESTAAGGTRISLSLDGHALNEFCGSDVDKQTSTALIKEARLYRLAENEAYGEHTLEITANGPGLRAYTLTFG